MTNGLPQGSSLSALLCLSYVADMPVAINTSGLFMDDTALWDCSDTVRGLKTLLQERVDRIEVWCQTNRIRLNGRKTKILMNEMDDRFSQEVANSCCEPSERVKYLGITLRATAGQSGPFEIELHQVAADLIRRCRVLKPLYRRLPGAFYRMFAEGLVISKLRYYLPILAGETEKTLKPLRTAYRQCLRLICGGLRTTPIPLLHSQSGMPPLEEMIREASLKQLMRNTERPNSLMVEDYKTYDSEPGSPYIGMVRGTWEMPPWMLEAEFEQRSTMSSGLLDTIYETDFVIHPTREVAKEYLRAGSQIPEADLYLFTDGSYQPPSDRQAEASGAGVVIQDSDGMTTLWSECRRVVPPCHYYHNEVQAMVLGLETLMERFCDEVGRSKLCIVTDSQSLLRHLEALQTRLRASVPESTAIIVEMLQELSKFYDIKFLWIPGHEGILGNEEADEKAKEGLGHDVSIGELYPISKFRLWIRRSKEASLYQYLDETVVESKLNPDAPPRIGFKTPRCSPTVAEGMSRQAEVMLFRIFSGHANTRIHWTRVGIEVEMTECRYCKGAPETIEHIVMRCPVIWRNDRETLEKLIRDQRTMLGGDMRYSRLMMMRSGPIYDDVVAVVEALVSRMVRL